MGELKEAGVDAAEMREAGVDYETLRSAYSLNELRTDAAYTDGKLGATSSQFYRAQFYSTQRC